MRDMRNVDRLLAGKLFEGWTAWSATLAAERLESERGVCDPTCAGAERVRAEERTQKRTLERNQVRVMNSR